MAKRNHAIAGKLALVMMLEPVWPTEQPEGSANERAEYTRACQAYQCRQRVVDVR